MVSILRHPEGRLDPFFLGYLPEHRLLFLLLKRAAPTRQTLLHKLIHLINGFFLTFA
jgi:hypothetical protein